MKDFPFMWIPQQMSCEIHMIMIMIRAAVPPGQIRTEQARAGPDWSPNPAPPVNLRFLSFCGPRHQCPAADGIRNVLTETRYFGETSIPG
jgi:hypothetical protein